MSILDGMITARTDVVETYTTAARIMAPALKDLASRMSERQKQVFELMQQGLSLADILGITKEERDALLAQGCQLLQVGEIRKARDTLTVLNQLEPLDERAIYALAATYQAEGDVATAGKMYVHFLALDATNPDGHLRLAECFLANKEYDSARESFEFALTEAEAGKGRPGTADYARRMLGIVAEQSASRPQA